VYRWIDKTVDKAKDPTYKTTYLGGNFIVIPLNMRSKTKSITSSTAPMYKSINFGTSKTSLKSGMKTKGIKKTNPEITRKYLSLNIWLIDLNGFIVLL
jgi:hypothetical protein